VGHDDNSKVPRSALVLVYLADCAHLDMRVLGGVQISQQAAVLPKEERAMRAEIMEILRSVDAQCEPIANGEVRPGTDEVERPISVDEVGSGIFASADRVGPQSLKEDDDDTMMADPTPLKQAPGDMGLNDSSEKENRGLPTPSDGYMDDEL
jgi:hypothetical protein